MLIVLIVFIFFSLIVIFMRMSNARKLKDFYDKLPVGVRLGGIDKFLESVSKRRLFFTLPQSDKYFDRMYQKMLKKSKPSFTYKVALKDYQICLNTCKKGKFKNGEVFFEKQISCYEKYIEWKDNNPDNSNSISFL